MVFLFTLMTSVITSRQHSVLNDQLFADISGKPIDSVFTACVVLSVITNDLKAVKEQKYLTVNDT